jgi:hypothetical protein
MLIAEYEALRAARLSLLGFEDIYGLRIWSGDAPSDDQVALVTAPPSHAEVLRALGPVARREVCRGGTVQVMSDDWANCKGCCGCAGCHTAGYRSAAGSYSRPSYDAARAQFEACRAIGIFVWRAAHVEAHGAIYQGVAGYDMLARIGRQIAAIGAVPAAIATFVRAAVAIDAKPIKGYWYRVEGKRGKAKAHQGLEGECTWIGESSYAQERPRGWRGNWNGRTSTTLRAAILPTGAEKPTYVPASSLTRIPTPASGADRTAKRDLAKAVRHVRPNYYGRTGRKADVGYVVAGPHKGVTGQVFWTKIIDVLGDDGRVGVKTSRDAEPLWIAARDVVGLGKRFVEFAKFEIERVADGSAKVERLDGVITGAYAVVEALVEAGFDEAAQEWGQAVKQIKGLIGKFTNEQIAGMEVAS